MCMLGVALFCYRWADCSSKLNHSDLHNGALSSPLNISVNTQYPRIQKNTRGMSELFLTKVKSALTTSTEKNCRRKNCKELPLKVENLFIHPDSAL